MSFLIELYSSPDKPHAGPPVTETIHGICTIYDLDFSTYPWPSWGKGQFCHNKDGSSSWQWLVREEFIWCQIWAWFKSSNANNWWKMFAFVLFEKKKNEAIKNESNGKSTTSLCSLFQWLIILSVKKNPTHISHLNFLWLWLQTFVLFILFSAKSQNHFSTQFLTRKNPIHYTALIPLILFNKLNRLSSLSLHPIFFSSLWNIFVALLYTHFSSLTSSYQCGYQHHVCPARSAFTSVQC